jgi:dTDP-glucose 4,6-dehydratase
VRKMSCVLVTGGCGFIGSALIRYALEESGFDGRIVNVDSLTYAGNPMNVADLEARYGGSRYFFEHADICDEPAMRALLRRYGGDTVIHLAAETHVDRSITDPLCFVRTNVEGTASLLSAVRSSWGDSSGCHFHHVSTDEVFGALGEEGTFTEETPYAPRSPYSASKAGSDHLVRAYHATYGLSVTLSHACNNYGPRQFPEKLIPLTILNILAREPLPVYGRGANVRDWIHVEDHARAIWAIAAHGRAGQSYNVGGLCERRNIDLVRTICRMTAALTGEPPGPIEDLIRFVADRPGHDFRYALDCGKIRAELGWAPRIGLEEGLDRTIRWYLQNGDWVAGVRSAECRRRGDSLGNGRATG